MRKIIPRKTTLRGQDAWVVRAPKDLGGGRKYFVGEAAKADAAKHAAALQKDRLGLESSFRRLGDDGRAVVLQQLHRVGGDPSRLRSAVDRYLEAEQVVASKTIEKIVEECIASKETSGKRKDYTRQLKVSLGNFTRGVGTDRLEQVTPAVIDAWLGGNGWSATTRRGYLTDVRTLYSYAIKRGYASVNTALAVERPEPERHPPKVYSVKQCAEILLRTRALDKKLIRYVVLQLFGGLRPKEARRLQKAAIRETVIRVDSHVSKTRQHRFVTIHPALQAWLNLGGDMQPRNIAKRWRRIMRHKSKVAVPLYKDGLRHSFCSYADMEWGAVRACQEAGHSEAIHNRDYRERVTREHAKEFFALTPQSVTKTG